MVRKGDLVYIPSSVTLFANGPDGTIRKIMKLSQPTSLLITNVHESTYEIFYQGEKWLVDKNKTYEG